MVQPAQSAQKSMTVVAEAAVSELATLASRALGPAPVVIIAVDGNRPFAPVNWAMTTSVSSWSNWNVKSNLPKEWIGYVSTHCACLRFYLFK